MNPKISVIIPIYNSEQYLSRAIDSLLSQTFQDFEILLINDGSTDTSKLICEEYIKKDSRIKAFHKENGGVSSARNLGLEKAIGNYIIHLDSDDFVDPGMLNKMHQETHNGTIDIVIANFFVDTGKKTEIIYQKEAATTTEVIKNMLAGSVHGSVCNKLVKREIYHNNNIRFDEKVNLCEDLLFNINYMSYASSIKFIEQAYLHYVERGDSAVHVWDSSKFNSYFYIVEKIEKLLNLEVFHDDIMYFKLQIKKDILRHGNMDATSFKSIYPESSKYIFRHPSFNIITKTAIYIATYVSYKFVKTII